MADHWLTGFYLSYSESITPKCENLTSALEKVLCFSSLVLFKSYVLLFSNKPTEVACCVNVAMQPPHPEGVCHLEGGLFLLGRQ